MKSKIYLLRFAIILTFCISVVSALHAQVNTKGVIYLSPKPGSHYNHTASNMVIRFNGQILNKNNVQNHISVSANGENIDFNATILEDGNTILIDPVSALPGDIKITVNVIGDVALANDQIVTPFSFDFYTAGDISPIFVNNEVNQVSIPAQSNSGGAESTSPTKSVSADIKAQVPMQVIVNKPRPDGYYFISTITYSNTPNRCMILDNQGRVVFEKFTPYYNLDFKRLTDTTFCYFDWNANCYYILNTSFNVIDSVSAGNGYKTDNHELQIDSKTGHYYLLAQELVIVDMSTIFVGGSTNATVLGLVIQELDQNKNVLFEWKTLDYLPITDAIGVNLGGTNIDYIHCNAIDLDTDSTLLLSSRHFSEIARINRKTGELMWRLGKGTNGNQFTFTNDPEGFSYQHNVRHLPNGNIMMFDNGSNRISGNHYSRAVEYKLDEENKTATMVWEYRHTPDVMSGFMGSVQRMPNGGTLIGWGGTTPVFTEIDSNNEVVFEVKMPGGQQSYRAFKYENIKDIINSNQALLPLLSDTLHFCNVNQINNVSNTVKPYIPSSISQDLYLISSQDSVNVDIVTETNNNFYAYNHCYFDLDYTYLNQADTTVCESSGAFDIRLHDDCRNLKFKWSTSDTTSSIRVNPLNGSAVYWVEMTNGSYYKKDSVKVTVVKMPDYKIIGQPLLSDPYQVLTYSVPFSPANNYKWDIVNGNIVSGYNTNAVTVQWGDNDTNSLSLTVTDKNGCSAQAAKTVLLVQTHTGINQLLFGVASNKVYPNPVNNELNIQVKGNFEYKLFDVTGRLVNYSGQLYFDQAVVEMNDLKPGYYMLDITSGDQTERVKVIKN